MVNVEYSIVSKSGEFKDQPYPSAMVVEEFEKKWHGILPRPPDKTAWRTSRLTKRKSIDDKIQIPERFYLDETRGILHLHMPL